VIAALAAHLVRVSWKALPTWGETWAADPAQH
jgi:hypothetical protein